MLDKNKKCAVGNKDSKTCVMYKVERQTQKTSIQPT